MNFLQSADGVTAVLDWLWPVVWLELAQISLWFPKLKRHYPSSVGGSLGLPCEVAFDCSCTCAVSDGFTSTWQTSLALTEALTAIQRRTEPCSRPRRSHHECQLNTEQRRHRRAGVSQVRRASPRFSSWPF